MKRTLLAAAFALAATSAFAATTKINNNSGLPIDEIYLSPPGQQAWGANLMDGAPEGSLDPKKSYAVSGLEDGIWDVRIEAPDEGVFCVIPKVKVKAGKVMNLTPEMGKACK